MDFGFIISLVFVSTIWLLVVIYLGTYVATLAHIKAKFSVLMKMQGDVFKKIQGLKQDDTQNKEDEDNNG